MNNLSSKNNPEVSGIVYLENLPENKVYLDLNEHYRTKFLQKAKELANNKWSDLAKLLGLKISCKNSTNLFRCSMTHPTGDWSRGRLVCL